MADTRRIVDLTVDDLVTIVRAELARVAPASVPANVVELRPHDSLGAQKLRRLVAEVSQRRVAVEVSRAAGHTVNQGSINRWARGQRRPRVDFIAAIEKALGIPHSDWATPPAKPSPKTGTE